LIRLLLPFSRCCVLVHLILDSTALFCRFVLMILRLGTFWYVRLGAVIPFCHVAIGCFLPVLRGAGVVLRWRFRLLPFLLFDSVVLEFCDAVVGLLYGALYSDCSSRSMG